MAPMERTKALARLHPKHNLQRRKAAAVEEEPDHLCKVCFKSFSSAQALGGHKNAHRRDREEASSQSVSWVLAPTPPPVMQGAVYVVGQGFLHSPRHPSTLPLGGGGLTGAAVHGSYPLQRFRVGEGSLAVQASSPIWMQMSSSSSNGLEALQAGCGNSPGSSGVPDAPCQPMATRNPGGNRADQKGKDASMEEIDLTLRL